MIRLVTLTCHGFTLCSPLLDPFLSIGLPFDTSVTVVRQTEKGCFAHRAVVEWFATIQKYHLLRPFWKTAGLRVTGSRDEFHWLA